MGKGTHHNSAIALYGLEYSLYKSKPPIPSELVARRLICSLHRLSGYLHTDLLVRWSFQKGKTSCTEQEPFFILVRTNDISAGNRQKCKIKTIKIIRMEQMSFPSQTEQLDYKTISLRVTKHREGV